jgi:hypothetical protein
MLRFLSAHLCILIINMNYMTFGLNIVAECNCNYLEQATHCLNIPNQKVHYCIWLYGWRTILINQYDTFTAYNVYILHNSNSIISYINNYLQFFFYSNCVSGDFLIFNYHLYRTIWDLIFFHTSSPPSPLITKKIVNTTL